MFRKIWDWFFADPRFVRDRVALLVFGVVILPGLAWLVFSLTARLGKDEAWRPRVFEKEEEDPRPWPDFGLRFLPEIQRAAGHVRAGNTAEAKAILEGMDGGQLREAEHAERAAVLCELAVREGRLEEALDLAEFAVAIEPTPLRLFWRGNVLRKLKNYERAAGDFRAALETLPASYLLNNAALLLEIERGHLEQVERELRTRESVGLEHTRPAWAFAAAALELERGRPNAAAVFLRAGVPALPAHEAGWLLDFEPLKKHQNEPAVIAFFFQTSDERWRPRALVPIRRRSAGEGSGAVLPRLSAEEELLLVRPGASSAPAP